MGVSAVSTNTQALDEAMQQVDAASYRGRAAGRNSVEWGPA